MIDLARQELRSAVRSLAKCPGLTLTVVVTLALGIGANAVFFGFVEGVWTRPLPGVHQPARLVHVNTRSEGGDLGDLSYPEFLELRASSQSFSTLAATQRRQPLVYGKGFVDTTLSNVVSDGYFTTLGVRTHAGRLFTDRDAGSPSAPVLVMSHSYWRRRYAGDPGIVGQSVRLIDTHFTVIGVAAKDFRGTELWTDTDLWIPMTSWEALSPGEASLRRGNGFQIMGRLRPGATLGQARAEAQVVAGALASAFPATSRGRTFVLQRDRERRFRSGGSAPLVVLGLVGLVLLVACANAANLLMARAEARRRATATRVALGCGRRRLTAQALAESAVLVLLAATTALVSAHWGIRGLSALLSPPDPRFQNQFHLDGRIALFTLLVSALAVLLASLGPAFQASRTDVAGAMRDVTPTSRRRLAAGDLLVGAQMAASMFLLALAALFVRSLVNVSRADLGFERKGVLAVSLFTPDGAARTRTFYDDLLDRLRGLPRVKRACLASRAPLSGSGGGSSDEVMIPGRDDMRSDSPLRLRQTRVSAGYFKLLGTRLLRGREFDDHDTEQAQRVVVINETMARTFWPGQDPVGRTFRVGTRERARDYAIVGVVQDARVVHVAERPEPHMYLALPQSRPFHATLLVESVGDPLALAQPIRGVVAALDPNVACTEVTTLGLLIQSSAQPQKSTVVVGLLLATLALGLAALGLYAVISYSVRRRTRELGVRIALGAQRADVIGVVMRRGLLLSAGSCLLGVAGALLAAPLVSGVLYGVPPRDGLSFAVAAAVLMTVAALASYAPARRAAKVDPVRALRCE